MAQVTRHARKRFKQRLGVHDTNKNAKRALRDGLTQADVHGDKPLQSFMAALFFRNRRCNNIRLYKGMTYIFAGDRLVTVFPIPDRFRDLAQEAQKRKEQANEQQDDGLPGEAAH